MTQEEWTTVKRDLLKDEKKAFERIYGELWSRLYAASYNYVRDKATAQEIVQEVFVKLWIKRERLQEINDIPAYAMSAVKFQVYDYFDKKAVVERYINNASQNQIRLVDNTDHQVHYDDTFELITTEIEKLPGTTKKIFRLSRFEQFSNEEIASKLDVSVKTVEYHITQSLKKLRVRLGSLLFSSLLLPAICYLIDQL
jgi:RNA polymerase sigma-70 factor (ECF subfamily)